MSKKRQISQRLKKNDFDCQIPHKEQEQFFRARINSALRSRLNQSNHSSELHIKHRTKTNSGLFEDRIREEYPNDENRIWTDSVARDASTNTHNGNITHFIRARLSQWESAKESLYKKFLNQVDFEEIKGISDQQLSNRLRISIEEFVDKNIHQEFFDYRSKMKTELIDELLGLGPLEPLCRDNSITEIMVNGPYDVFVEVNGIIQPSEQKFRSEQHLRRIIERIVSKVGRRIDESTPIVNARLSDGSRVNAVIPPVALDGSSLTIRRFPERALTTNDLIALGSMTREMAYFIQSAINGALNIIVSGGTGSGKTTFLNIASGYIPSNERIVTIEDSAELQLQQRHVVRMETRTANVEGKGEITIRDLVKNALRMRPDRLVIGECRSGEAFDMLQAMNTGHDGSLTTLHANSPADAIDRFAAMVLMSGIDIPERVIRSQITSAIDLIVHVERMPDGSRKVTHISEIAPFESEAVKLKDIFKFEGKLEKETGNVVGMHQLVSFPSFCYEKLLANGEDLSEFKSKEV